MKDKFIKIITSCFYVGYLPASGTFATLFFLPFALVLIYLQIKLNNPYIIPVVTLLLLIISIPLSTEGERIYKEKDSHKIVIDEVVGYLFTIIFFDYFYKPYPDITTHYRFYIQFLVLSFVLFRFFDIVKIFPCNVIQKLKGGTGVVLDDVVAGIYSNIILVIVFKYNLLS